MAGRGDTWPKARSVSWTGGQAGSASWCFEVGRGILTDCAVGVRSGGSSHFAQTLRRQ